MFCQSFSNLLEICFISMSAKGKRFPNSHYYSPNTVLSPVIIKLYGKEFTVLYILKKREFKTGKNCLTICTKQQAVIGRL